MFDVVCLKVLLELFQKLVGAAAIGGRASQGAKFLIVRKRHRGVNAEPSLGRGEPHKWGVPLFPQRLSEIVCPLFSLRPEAQRKKLGKKEHAVKEVSPCAATNAPRVGLAVAF